MHGARRRSSLFDQRDGDAHDREFVDEVGGAVESVDQPVALSSGAAAFLTDDGDIRGSLQEHGDDRLLGFPVYQGHVVPGTLFLDFPGSHSRLADDASAFNGGAQSQVPVVEAAVQKDSISDPEKASPRHPGNPSQQSRYERGEVFGGAARGQREAGRPAHGLTARGWVRSSIRAKSSTRTNLLCKILRGPP